MNTRTPLIFAALSAGLLLASGQAALGFEVAVFHQDLPQCDPLFVPELVDELGPPAPPAPPNEGFPPDEQIDFVWDQVGPFYSCGPSDAGESYILVITNNTGRDFVEVWFVADSEVFWIGNFDGLVNDAPAMRIDSTGINPPLIWESIAADEIFQNGEIWQFQIHGWLGPPPPQLGSPGGVGMGSFVDNFSTASIIAIPEIIEDNVGMTFSFDFQGPTNGLIDGFGFRPIFEGDIVTVTPPGPPGPNPPAPAFMPPPGLQIGYNAHFRILNLLPGIVPNWRQDPVAEVDALSYGNDTPGRIRFSVDEFAEGDPSVVNAIVPEGAMGAIQAAADTFDYRSFDVPVPIGGPFFLHGNAHATDGDGDGPNGVGLLEPNPPLPGLPDEEGDNLDAVDFFTRTPELAGPVFFSLDSHFPDPIEGPPANTASALTNGFFGGDVLIVFNTAPAVAVPFIYAPAALLGLDQIAGEDSDDLDALSVIDNGDGEYVPADDRILFSVRRGSAVIGVPDSRLGLPITPGDILTPPLPGTPLLPAIYITAEQLGLKTRRSGDVCGVNLPPLPVEEPENLCDDLDALDRISLDLLDSDGDGVLDIADNCTYQPNPSQLDSNGDNIGNFCDPDIAPIANDCIVNFLDLSAMKAAFLSNPVSPNWNPDADLDGNGVVNFLDLAIVKAYFLGPPGPSGLPNPCG